MEVEDIFSIPEKLVINGKEYKYEFDNKAYATLEALLQNGIFKIRDLLLDNNLGFEKQIELVCAGLIKHHSTAEVQEVRTQLTKHLGILTTISETVIAGFLKGIMPPEIYIKMQEIKEKIQKFAEKPEKKKKNKKNLIG